MGSIWIVHEAGDPALVTTRAFDDVWEPRGWTKVAPDLGDAHNAGLLVDDEANLSADYIREVLAGREPAAEPEPAPAASSSKKKTAPTPADDTETSGSTKA